MTSRTCSWSLANTLWNMLYNITTDTHIWETLILLAVISSPALVEPHVPNRDRFHWLRAVPGWLGFYFYFYKKNIHARITKLSLLFKIFCICTNTFFQLSWQVTDACSMKPSWHLPCSGSFISGNRRKSPGLMSRQWGGHYSFPLPPCQNTCPHGSVYRQKCSRWCIRNGW
jgi:hypothetical protein